MAIVAAVVLLVVMMVVLALSFGRRLVPGRVRARADIRVCAIGHLLVLSL